MTESLRELNEVCQKPDYKTKGNWYVRTILRDASLPMTWLLLHTRVTANQVTLASLAISLLGMGFLATPGSAAFLTGVALLQLWYYLDHVDGQIARYRKTDCLTGRFLDFLTHHIVHTALFFAMGFYAYAVTGNILFLVWGFAASLAMLTFNVTHDVKYKTFFEKILTRDNPRGMTLRPRDSTPEVEKGKASLPKRIFSLLHKLCEIHVMMNILTLAAVLKIFTADFDFRFALFLVYGVIAPLIAIVKLAYILKTQMIDAEFQDLFARHDE